MNCVDKIAKQYQIRDSFFSTMLNSKDFEDLGEEQQKELKQYIKEFNEKEKKL